MTNEKTIQLLAAAKYDPTKPLPPQQIVFRMEGRNIGSMQNFITITGMPKNGKGKFISGMIAAAITRQDTWGMTLRLPEDQNRVALFDTDQGIHEFYKNIELITTLSGGFLPSAFDAFNVRDRESEEITEMIKTYLDCKPDCGVLIIDNIADLLTNYNDESQSKKVINFLKRITKEKNILVINVLHTGKGNGTTIGHLGALNDRYAQSVLKVEKMKDRPTYLMSLDVCRTAGQVQPIEIYYNEFSDTWDQWQGGGDTQADTNIKRLKKRPNEFTDSEHKYKIARMFTNYEVLIYSDLVNAIKEAYGVGKNWAVDCVVYYQDNNMIWKVDGGYTNVNRTRLFVEK